MKLVAAMVVAAVVLLGSPLGVQAEDGSSAVVSPTVLRLVYEVSHDGRWIAGGHEGIVDRQTGSISPGDPDWWFVRDNPKLRLNRQWSEAVYPDNEVYLVDVSSGARKRVDTDSRGKPLKPSWAACRWL